MKQRNVGVVGGLKRSQSKTNLKKSTSQNQLNQVNNKKKTTNLTSRRPARINNPAVANGKVGLTRSKSRTNITTSTLKRVLTTKGLKRTSSLPNLRDPLSVHNRLGYQSPQQVAYRNRVKRAKQLLLQRQSQRQAPSDFLVNIL